MNWDLKASGRSWMTRKCEGRWETSPSPGCLSQKSRQLPTPQVGNSQRRDVVLGVGRDGEIKEKYGSKFSLWLKGVEMESPRHSLESGPAGSRWPGGGGVWDASGNRWKQGLVGKGQDTFLEPSMKMGLALSSRLSWVQIIHGVLERTQTGFPSLGSQWLRPWDSQARKSLQSFPAKVLGQWTSQPCPITKVSSFKQFLQAFFAVFSACSKDVFHANNLGQFTEGHPDLALTLWSPLLVPIQALLLPCSWSSFLFTPWAKKKF